MFRTKVWICKKEVCKMNRRVVERNRILVSVGITMIFVLLIVFLFTMQSNAKQDHEIYTYYTSVEVHPGDSLWSLAATYCDADANLDYEAYMDEVRRLNHLSDDEIHSDSYLIVPYYSTQMQ